MKVHFFVANLHAQFIFSSFNTTGILKMRMHSKNFCSKNTQWFLLM